MESEDESRRPNTLEIHNSDPNAPDQMPAFATTIKSKGYVGIKSSDAKAEEACPVTYQIYQYVFVNKDTVQVRGGDGDVWMKAISDEKASWKDRR